MNSSSRATAWLKGETLSAATGDTYSLGASPAIASSNMATNSSRL